jgi:hypothetical protein
MKTALKAGALTFAMLPGVGILASGLGVPPEQGMKLIFAGVIEAFGVLSLVILAVNQMWIRGLSPRTITVASSGIAVVAFFLLVAYLGCYQYCVVTLDPRGTVYFPLWNGGDLASLVSDAGGRAAAIDKWGRYAVYEAVKGMGEYPAIITDAVLLVLYAGFFTSLTWAFGLLATHEEPKAAAPGAAPAQEGTAPPASS